MQRDNVCFYRKLEGWKNYLIIQGSLLIRDMFSQRLTREQSQEEERWESQRTRDDAVLDDRKPDPPQGLTWEGPILEDVEAGRGYIGSTPPRAHLFWG